MRKPAFIALIPFVIGIVAAYFVDVSLTLVFALLLTCLLAAIALTALHEPYASSAWKWLYQLPFWMMLVLAGAFRYELVTRHFPANHLSRLPIYGQKIRLEGTINNEPELRHGRTIRALLKVQRVETAGQERQVCGNILLNIRSTGMDIDFGDHVCIEGRLRKPPPARNPGGFDYQKYLLRKGIFGLMSVRAQAVQVLEKGRSHGFKTWVILPIKHSVRHSIDRNLLGAPGALLKGVLLGERSRMPQEIVDAFSTAGVIHVLAVSGLHVGLIAGIFFFVLKFMALPEKWAVGATVAALVLYAYVTDLRPSVVRASMMASMVLIGMIRERNTNVINSLSIAALLILAKSPQSLFDLGFQLSFSATLSIVSLYDPINRLFPKVLRRQDTWWGKWLGKWVFGALAVSLAAQVGTAPIIAYYFNRVPIISIVANIVVIPTIAIVVALGLLTCAFGPWLAAIATAANAVNWVCLHTLIKLVRFFAEIPYASFYVSTPSGFFLLGYFVLLWLSVKAVHSLRHRKLLVFGLLLVANVYVWQGMLSHRDVLEITFLDVGQGDAIFVAFPNGRTMLVDGGERRATFDAGEQIIEPFLRYKGIRHLDIVLATHGDSDHIGGLCTVLQHFKVGHLLDSGQYAATPSAHELYEWVEKKGVLRHSVSAGDRLVGLGKVRAMILHPTEDFVEETGEAPQGSNNTSVVLKLSYHDMDLLLTGDIEGAAEQALMRWKNQLDVEILKVPHHGSKTSSSERFLDAVQPEWGIIPVGAYNRLGHPAPKVLKRYAQSDVQVYRTDRHGAVIFTCSDKGVKIKPMLEPTLFEERF